VKEKIIKGTFIQPEFIIDWSREEYDKHFERYLELGFDHIILQWSEYMEPKTGTWFTYYPTNIFNRITKNDLLTKLLEAGSKYQIKVYLGLGTSKDWWSIIKKSPMEFDKWFSKQADENIILLKDIWSTYSNNCYRQAIAGWYIAYEPDNINFNSKEKRNVFIKHCERIVRTGHEYSKLPIVMSPFFNRAFEQNYGPQKWGGLMHDIAKGTGIDIIAVQDGIGCRRQAIDDKEQKRSKALKDVDKWFKASLKGIKKARNNTRLWADIETFTEKIEEGKSVFYSASIKRIVKQIKIEKPFVEKITSFSFQAYQDFDKDEELFESYKKYVSDYKSRNEGIFWLDRIFHIFFK